MKFRQKMLLAMVWLLTLGYGVGGMLLISQSFQSGLAQEQANAVSSYEMTLQTVQLVNLVDIRQDFSSIRTALERMDRVSNQAGVLLSRDGEAIYQAGEPVNSLPETEGSKMLLFARDDRRYLQISGPVQTNDLPLRLSILYEITPIYSARSEQISTYHRVFLLMLGLGGAAAWAIAWILTRPLGRLSAAARRLAAGRLETRAKLPARDEIGLLGAEFDRMADQLSETITAQQQEMERQEQFMGSFAHELKTPMTSIIGYADLLRGQSLDEEEAQEAANYIFSEGKRLESLSLKLLDLLLVKHQELMLTDADPAVQIERLVTHLQPVYRENGIVLQCRCEPGFCKLEPDLFASVLTNLLDNARKALTKGGNIYVLGKQEADGYQIRVLDNGRGMPEEAIRHLTEAFYRVDKSRSRAQGGVGLGLTLCSRILDLHNGTISFTSREGKGTCVTVTLPRAELGEGDAR
jgi:signal transduction histidine kinase